MERYAGRSYLGSQVYTHNTSFGCPFACNFCAVVALSKRRWIPESARRMAFALPQGGEFAFVLFAAAAAQGTMDRGIADLLVVAVTASMLLTPLAFGVHARVIAAVPKEGDRASKIRAAARELTNELEVFTKDDWIRVLEGLAIPDPEGALAVLLDANAVFEPRAGFYRAVDLTP